MSTNGSNGRRRPAGADTRKALARNGSPDVKGGSADVKNGSNIFKVRITSDFDKGRDIQKRILDAVKHCAFDSQSEFAIKLALEEGLINAIKHGNKLDPAKHVKVEASVTAKQAEITIEDEGAGFNRSDVPDPTLEENLDKCSGRGILLIEAYMDRAEWTNRGRRLHMIKKNNA